MASASIRCSTAAMDDFDAYKRRFGDAVRARRRAAGLTQEELAEAAESSTEWISQVERGIGMPSMELSLRLARAVGDGIVSLVQAASDPASGRRRVQELILVVRDLDDRDLDVLLAAAREMARTHSSS